ncbi:hypothetical protein [Clavibacter sp. VKM Ac-2872]|uniref:hypothetical protein n=1 Tax=Clavibacter sp. VKM Ac-2872 TaxID=2783812 RepID=UPI00188BFDB7|nr:hypothetical protein [Clavibacter sp. VKM Ac-2872]MBF4625629.1 hypothetical protein [Clavibacter sp. VKM Ac-2872]
MNRGRTGRVAAIGGVAAAIALSSPAPAQDAPDLGKVIDGMEAAVTPMERRAEQEAQNDEAADAARDDAPGLDRELVRPDDVTDPDTTTVHLDPPPAETSRPPEENRDGEGVSEDDAPTTDERSERPGGADGAPGADDLASESTAESSDADAIEAMTPGPPDLADPEPEW